MQRCIPGVARCMDTTHLSSFCFGTFVRGCEFRFFSPCALLKAHRYSTVGSAFSCPESAHNITVFSLLIFLSLRVPDILNLPLPNTKRLYSLSNPAGSLPVQPAHTPSNFLARTSGSEFLLPACFASLLCLFFFLFSGLPLN